MQLSRTMLHPYSKKRFYIPCTVELGVHLFTDDAMQTQPWCNTFREMILIHGIMHDTMTSLSTWCMANTKKIIYNTKESFFST